MFFTLREMNLEYKSFELNYEQNILFHDILIC